MGSIFFQQKFFPKKRKNFFPTFFVFPKKNRMKHHNVKMPRTPVIRTFSLTDLMKLYNVPAMVEGPRRNICIPSFGGGLVGDVDQNGILTNGDCQNLWANVLGMDPNHLPTVKIVTVNGAINDPNSDQGSTIENSIDVQAVGALCPNSNITLILATQSTTWEEICQVAEGQMLGYFSSSWGMEESNSSVSELQSIDTHFQKWVSKGICICAAAGDTGASDSGTGLNVDFPGSSPHVVCCGGTRLISSTDTYDSTTQETVWNDDAKRSATGGGQSKVFPKPAYQSKITMSNMRMVPDVAMDADPPTGVNFMIFGQLQPIGGTSVVAPFMTGYLARIGCKTWPHPILYSVPRAECFHDIVSGNNGGQTAGVGYDECSGLGSINGTPLAKYLTSLPSAPTVSITDMGLLPIYPVNSVVGFGITGTLGTGVTFDDLKLVFTSSTPQVASVSTDGLMTCHTTGSTLITASSAVATPPAHASLEIAVVNVNPSKRTQMDSYQERSPKRSCV